MRAAFLDVEIFIGISVNGMDNKWHYIYKTTILQGELKDHYYIGRSDKTMLDCDPYNDGYYGSGVIITNWLSSHNPVEGFNIHKEIIEFNEDAETNAKRETVWVGDLYLTDPLCLNRCGGGFGPTGFSEETLNLMKQKAPWKGKKMPSQVTEKMSKSRIGKKVSNETKKKISDATKNKPFTPEHIQNIKLSWADGKREITADTRAKMIKGHEKPIIQLTIEGVIIGRFGSAKIAEIETGVPNPNITNCCKHPDKHKSAKGFKWMYEKDYLQAIDNAS